jgi:DNA (cytosine-5)-methyltransferase 1
MDQTLNRMPKMKTIKVCTLFSGYDSQCMALDRLKEQHPEFDYELVAWAEIDKFAIQAHNAVYPQWADRNYGDVSKIDWNQVPDFDLLTYSSPCQDFSNAGKQKGGVEGSGTRSSLLWECRRAILAKKPKYLLMENVAALVSQKFIGTFNQWQLELERYGYTNFSQVLNAKDYGVPQNRERIFMVSILDCEQAYYFPTPVELTKRLKDVMEENVDERYYLSQQAIDGFGRRTDRNAANGNGFGWKPTEGEGVVKEPIVYDDYNGKVREDQDTIGTITTNCGTKAPRNGFKIVEPVVKQVGNLIGEHQVMTPKRTEYGKQIRKQYEAGEVEEQRKNIQQLEPRNDGVSNTLTSVQKDNYVLIPEATKEGYIPMEIGGVCDLSYPTSKTRRGRVQDGGTVAPTLTCGCEGALRRIEKPKIEVVGDLNPNDRMNSGSMRQQNYVIGANGLSMAITAKHKMHEFKVQQVNFRIRKLTERECFRLMGVCEEYIDLIQAAGISRSQQYKMAGNSIVVNVLVAIFRQLLIGNKNAYQQLEIF